MSLRKRYQSNKDKEEQGVLINFGYNEDGSPIGIRVRRLWKYNQSYTKAFSERLSKYNVPIELLPEKAAEEILMGSFIDGIMVDWENLMLSDVTGNDNDTGFAEFTYENAIQLFQTNRGLYDDVYKEAMNIANFQDSSLEKKAKN